MFNSPKPTDVEAALAGWQVSGILGKGGFKVAYHSEWQGKPEALKLFYVPDFGSDPDDLVQKESFMARLAREVGLLRDCGSAHLVKLASLTPTPINLSGAEFVAYSEELLDGQSLKEIIAAKNLPSEREVATMMLHVAEAICELWNRHSCVHRDIKPDNIRRVADPSRGFVLLDLGISFDAEGTRLTEGGFCPGTPLYRAPEMLEPDYWNNLNERTDMYCLGVTAFEFATGVHPLANGSLSVTARIRHEQPTKLLFLRPGFDRRLASLIDQLNRKSPALRGTLGNLIKALGEWI